MKATFDADDDNIESWITVRGNHIPIKKGESKEEAVKNFIASKSDKESSVRANKPESIGNAAQKVVSQVSNNREIYKEHKKQENGKKWDKLTSERGNKPTQVGEAAKKAVEVTKEVATGKDPDGLIEGVTQEYIEMEQEREGLRNEIVMAKQRGRKFEEQKLREEMSKLEGKMTEEVKRIESIKKARPYKEKMQEVMNSYPNIYGWEKQGLEDFAQGLSNDLEKYKGQEKEVLEEYANIFNSAVNRMGMWVDTPTLVKRDFIKKMQEEYSKQEKSEKFDYGPGWPKSPKFEKLTKQYMPATGESDNELGEMLRSINRATYRYYNDGDVWNKGYGKETVNAAVKHLTELAKNKDTPRHISRGLENGLYELKKAGKDKDKYETGLKLLLQTVEFANQSDIDALLKMKRNS